MVRGNHLNFVLANVSKERRESKLGRITYAAKILLVRFYHESMYVTGPSMVFH